MNKRVLWLVGGVVLLAAALLLVLRKDERWAKPSAPAGEEAMTPAAAVGEEPAARRRAARARGRDEEPAPESLAEEGREPVMAVPPEPPEPEVAPWGEIKFRGNQILANVNGRLIFGKDLAAFSPQNLGREIGMSPEMYQARLDRAIDRELTFQAAEERGIELADSEIQGLRAAAARQHDDGNAIYLLGDEDAVIQHDAYDAEALVLEKKIMMQDAGFTPYVTTEKVDAYYAEHVDEYGPLPDDPEARAAAWRAIETEIRKRLATEVRAEYDQQREIFFHQLRMGADIALYLSVESQP